MGLRLTIILAGAALFAGRGRQAVIYAACDATVCRDDATWVAGAIRGQEECVNEVAKSGGLASKLRVVQQPGLLSGPCNGAVWDMAHSDDPVILRAEFRRLNHGSPGYAVVMTSRPIRDAQGRQACGYNVPAADPAERGCILAIFRAPRNAIAHEIGHGFGYAGEAPGDNVHSSDENNVMCRVSINGTGTDVKYREGLRRFVATLPKN